MTAARAVMFTCGSGYPLAECDGIGAMHDYRCLAALGSLWAPRGLVTNTTPNNHNMLTTWFCL